MNTKKVFSRRLMGYFLPILFFLFLNSANAQEYFNLDAPTVTEGNSGNSTLTFTISLTGSPTGSGVTIGYSFIGGTATVGTDYSSATGTVFFPSTGGTTDTFTVDVFGDIEQEDDETIIVELFKVSGDFYLPGVSATNTATVYNDDVNVTMGITSGTDLTEGTSDQVAVTITLDQGVADTDITFAVNLASGSTAVAGDYIQTGNFVIPAGTNTVTVVFDDNNDSSPEANETAILEITGISANTADGGKTVSEFSQQSVSFDIIDDDPELTMYISDNDGNEDDQILEGSTLGELVLELSKTTGNDVTINLTVGGTATYGTDINSFATSVTILAGQTSASIPLLITDDNIYEGDGSTDAYETVTFSVASISSTSTVTNNSTTQTLTIESDDTAPTVTVQTGVTYLEETGTMGFNITLSNPSYQTISMNLSAVGTGTGTFPTEATDFVGGVTTTTASIPAGSLTTTASFNIKEDPQDEENETFDVVPTITAGTVSGTSNGSGTITDDDARPTVNISDASASEGSNLVFTVTLTNGTELGNVVLNFGYTDGTATGGADYDNTTAKTLTFTVAEMTAVTPTLSKTISVASLTDNVFEGDDAPETFTFRVATSTGTTVTTTDTGIGTITDAGAAPSATISSGSALEGTDGSITYTIAYAGGATRTQPITFALSGVDGTATSADYTVPASVTIAAGSNSNTFSVTIADDNIDEVGAAETFQVSASQSSGGSVSSVTNGSGTITDDDLPPNVVINAVSASVTEGTPATFTAALTGGTVSSQAITVTAQTRNLTSEAVAGSDYTASSLVFSFNALATSPTNGPLSVPTTVDNVYEPHGAEDFEVFISTTTGTVGTTTDTEIGTIADGTSEPSIQIGSSSVTEGGLMSFDIQFTSSTTVSEDVTVSGLQITSPLTVETADFTSGTFTLSTTSLTIPAGASGSSVSATIQSLDDVIYERADGGTTETFVVTSTSASSTNDGSYSVSNGSGTITDNDSAPIVVISSPAAATEGSTFNYDITVTGSSDVDVSVSVASSNTSAIADNFAPVTLPYDASEIQILSERDYNAYSGSFTFTVAQLDGGSPSVTGSNTQSFSIASNVDNVYEGAKGVTVETFAVSATSVSNATCSTCLVYTDIINNDNAPAISLSASDNFPDEDTDVSNLIAVLLANSPLLGTVVDIDGTIGVSQSPDISASDYNLTSTSFTFTAPAVNLGTRNIGTFTPVADHIYEDEFTETVTFSITSATDATIGGSSQVIEIRDDESIPVIRIDSPSLSETDGNMTFTVTFSDNLLTSQNDILINVATTDGGAESTGSVATADLDFNAATINDILISAGMSSTTFTVSINDDAVYEDSEDFTVTATGPGTGSGDVNFDATSFGIGTIDNDEGIPTVTLQNASELETAEGITFNAVLSPISEFPISVTVTANDTGDATGTVDFDETTTPVVNFPALSSTVPFTITVIDDLIVETDETFEVEVISLGGTVTGLNNTATGTIIDDDEVAEINLAINTIGTTTISVTEASAASTTVMAYLPSGPVTSVNGITITLATKSTSDAELNDFDLEASNPYWNSGTLQLFIPAGSNSASFDMSTVDDLNLEPNETWTLEIVSVTGGAITGTSDEVSITILDDAADEAYVTISADELTITEGGTTNTSVITVDINPVSEKPIDVTLALTGVTTGVTTNAADASDYTITSGTLTMTGLTSGGSVTIQAINDNIFEPELSEDLKVSVASVVTGTDSSTPFNIVINAGTQTPPVINFDMTDIGSVNEGDLMTFDIVSDVPSSEDITVSVGLNTGASDGYLTMGDYTDGIGGAFAQFVIPALTTTASIDIEAYDDMLWEGTEDFVIDIVSIAGSATTGTSDSALATIISDDAAPGFTITFASDPIAETAGSNTVTVTLDDIIGEDGSVDLTVGAATTATATDDYTFASPTLFFTPNTSTALTTTVVIVNDILYEDDEDVEIEGSSAEFGADANVFTIDSEDAAPVVSVSINGMTGTALLSESLVNVDLQVELDAVAGKDLDFTITWNDGVALEGDDYFPPSPVSATITVLAGASTGTATFGIDDAVFEGGSAAATEDFEIVVTATDAAVDASLEGSPIIVEIQDDEPAPVVRIVSASGPTSVTIAEASSQAETFTIGLYSESNTNTLVTSSLPVDVQIQVGGDASYTNDPLLDDYLYSTTSGVTFSGGILSVTFAAGENQKSFTLSAISDQLYEGVNETITLDLISATNAAATNTVDNAHTVEIQEESNIPVITITNESGDEDGADLNFVISSTPPSDETVVIEISFVDITADGLTNSVDPYPAGNDDYDNSTQYITFAPRELSKDLFIDLLDDPIYEQDETFEVHMGAFTDPFGGVDVSAVGTGTIVNDDERPMVSLSVDNATINEVGSEAAGILPVGDTNTNVFEFDISLPDIFTGPSGAGLIVSDGSAEVGAYIEAIWFDEYVVYYTNNGEVYVSSVLNPTGGNSTFKIVNDGTNLILLRNDVYIGDLFYDYSGSIEGESFVGSYNDIGLTEARYWAGTTSTAGAPNVRFNETSNSGGFVNNLGTYGGSLEGYFGGAISTNVTATLSQPSTEDVYIALDVLLGDAEHEDNGDSYDDFYFDAYDTGTGYAVIYIPAGSNSGTMRVASIDDDIDEGDGETVTVEVFDSEGTYHADYDDYSGIGSIDIFISDDETAPVAYIDGNDDQSEGNDLEFDVVLSHRSDADIYVTIASVANGTAEDTDFDVTSDVILVPALSYSGTNTFVVSTTDDRIEEDDDEYFNIDITAVSGGVAGIIQTEGVASVSITNSAASGTIYDNDDEVEVQVLSASVVEGTGDLVYTVEIDQTPDNPNAGLSLEGDLAIGLYTEEISNDDVNHAQEGTDYVYQSELDMIAIITEGMTSTTVTVSASNLFGALSPTDDDIDEISETFYITVDGLTSTVDAINNGAISMGGYQAEMTIVDNDDPPFVTVNDGTANDDEGFENSNVTVDFVLNRMRSQDTQIEFTFTNGTAIAGGNASLAEDDYNATTQTILVPAYSMTGSFVLPTIDDVIYEGPSENLTVAVTGGTPIVDASGLGVTNSTGGTITIIENDPMPTIQTLVNVLPGGFLNEGTTGEYVMLLVGQTAVTTYVEFTINSGTLGVKDELAADPNYRYMAELADFTIDYGTSAPPAALTNTTGNVYMVEIAPFTPQATVLVEAVSETPKFDEYDNEMMFFEITNVIEGIESGAQEEEILIVDQDVPSVASISFNDTNVTEGDASGNSTVVTVTLDYASDKPIEVTIGSVANPGCDEAIDGVDYTIDVTTLMIPAGSTSVTTTVTTIGDFNDEPMTETITVGIIDGALSGTAIAVDAVDITSGTTTASILLDDDDVQPTVAIVQTTSSTVDELEAEGATANRYFTYQVEITSPYTSNRDIYVNLAIDDATGTATSLAEASGAGNPADHSNLSVTQLLIPAGATASSGTATIEVYDDNLYEGDDSADPTDANEAETIVVNITSFEIDDCDMVEVTGLAGTSTTTSTIIDSTEDLPEIRLSSSANIIDEDDVMDPPVGATNVFENIITATLYDNDGDVIGAQNPISFDFIEIPGDASLDLDATGTGVFADYTPLGISSLTFVPGVTSVSLTITAVEDDKYEEDETVTIEITGVSGPVEDVTSIGDSQMTTILDNDPAPYVELVGWDPINMVEVPISEIREEGGEVTLRARLMTMAPKGSPDFPIGVDVTINLFGKILDNLADEDVDYTINTGTSGLSNTAFVPATDNQIVIPAYETVGYITVTSLQDFLEKPVSETANIYITSMSITNGQASDAFEVAVKLVEDVVPPSGFAVNWITPEVTYGNEEMVSFEVTGLNPNDYEQLDTDSTPDLSWTISDGSASVMGTIADVMTNTSVVIDNVDVSALTGPVLTVTIQLTDDYENTSLPTNDSGVIVKQFDANGLITGTTVVTSKSTATVNRHYGPIASVSIADASMIERDGTSIITVTLNENSPVEARNYPVTVYLTGSTASPAGIEDVDFMIGDLVGTADNVLSFSATETSKTIAISSINDFVDENDEEAVVNVSMVDQGVVSPTPGNSAEITIVDDVIAPTGFTVTWDVPEVTYGNEMALSFTVSNLVLTDYDLVEPDATPDLQWTISDNATPSNTVSGTVDGISTTAVNITGVDLTGWTGASITLSVTMTDVYNNSSVPAVAPISRHFGPIVSITPDVTSIQERDGVAVLTVSLNENSPAVARDYPVTVTLKDIQMNPTFTDLAGVGEEDTDYYIGITGSADNVLTFAAGVGSLTIDLVSVDDCDFETNEDARVNFTVVNGVIGADNTAIVKLLDDVAAPSGFSAMFIDVTDASTTLLEVNPGNVDDIGFVIENIADVDLGGTYSFTISDGSTTTPISGSGSLSGTSITISPDQYVYPVAGMSLADYNVGDQLTLKLTLTDPCGNVATVYEAYVDRTSGPEVSITVIAETLNDVYENAIFESDPALGGLGGVAEIVLSIPEAVDYDVTITLAVDPSSEAKDVPSGTNPSADFEVTDSQSKGGNVTYTATIPGGVNQTQVSLFLHAINDEFFEGNNEDAEINVASVVNGVFNSDPTADNDITVTIIEDNVPPAGFFVEFIDEYVNELNKTEIDFRIINGEIDAFYKFEITSSNGGTPFIRDYNATQIISGDEEVIGGLDLSALSPGVITLKVWLKDQNGNESVFITELHQDQIQKYGPDTVFPEGFSPNGDGINDLWLLPGIEEYPDNTISIFNRYGKPVWEAKGYDNVETVFAGIANVKGVNTSASLPDGTYFYVANLDGQQIIKGFIVIRR